MTRIKTVYETRMVCHLWANRHPHAIRNASGNVSTSCGRIYSYGHHFVMGAFLDNPAKGGEPLLIWCTSTYGNTTSRHQSHAWGALSQTQRMNSRAIPFRFSESDLSVRFGGLAKMARGMVGAAADELSKAQAAQKYFAHHWTKAGEYLETARKLCRYIADKKGLKAIPALDETVNREDKKAVKADAARVEKLIQCATWLETAAQKLERAKQCQNDAESLIAQAAAGHTGEGFNRAIVGHLRDCRNSVEHAQSFYIKAGKKAAPDCARLLTWVAQNDAVYGPLAFREECEELRKRFLSQLARHTADLAIASRYGDKPFTTAAGYKSSGARSRILSISIESRTPPGFLAHAVPDSAVWQDVFAGDKKAAQAAHDACMRVRNRWERMRTADNLSKAITDLGGKLVIVESHKYGIPSRVDLERAISAYLNARGFDSHENALPAFYANQIAPLFEKHAEMMREYTAQKEREHVEKIEQWRAGARVYLPAGVPTMARIVGETVETSRGAVVPIEHALRLVRMARIVAARGGQSWADGSGPMVGHFRVNYIGPDMSARIGCHDFTSEEALRAAEMIESACASVATKSANG